MKIGDRVWVITRFFNEGKLEYAPEAMRLVSLNPHDDKVCLSDQFRRVYFVKKDLYFPTKPAEYYWNSKYWIGDDA